MTVLEIIIVVLALAVLVLGTGGYIAMTRRTQGREHKLLEQLESADRELARAHAADKGWDRATLEAAARSAAEERFGAGAVKDLKLVQVIDKPGTDADQAVFHVEAADGEHSITLGRTAGVWGPAPG
jgi:hypothetical protein